MAFQSFETTVVDHILTVTLNRPHQRNSFTRQMCLELGSLFDQADADDEVRVVILTGTGLSFCAGADLHEGPLPEDPDDRTAEQQEYVRTVGTIDGLVRDGGGWLALRIAQSLKPVIVAFNGSAVGVGVTMTLPADIRLAAESARFGLVFARRGIFPEGCSSWFLPRLVGISKAAEWVLTGRLFSAQEAHEAGLVSRVVADDALLEAATEIAAEIVNTTSAVSVAASRRMLWSMLSASSPWEAHVLETKALSGIATSTDTAEGFASFLEKRSPTFPMSVTADLPGFVPDWPAGAVK